MTNKTDNLREEFKLACKPIMQFLKTQYHPHAKVIVDCDSAELVIGEMAIDTLQTHGSNDINKCLHSHRIYSQRGPHLGEYCALCGKWLRWMPKKDVINDVIAEPLSIRDPQPCDTFNVAVKHDSTKNFENNDEESPF